MGAMGGADFVYNEHSISTTEDVALHAQAWLQEERKLTELPPATEKKIENTQPITPQVSGENLADTRREGTAPDSRQGSRRVSAGY